MNFNRLVKELQRRNVIKASISYLVVAWLILQIISIVLMITTARKQGLTDHVMGSVLINRAARY